MLINSNRESVARYSLRETVSKGESRMSHEESCLGSTHLRETVSKGEWVETVESCPFIALWCLSQKCQRERGLPFWC